MVVRTGHSMIVRTKCSIIVVVRAGCSIGDRF